MVISAVHLQVKGKPGRPARAKKPRLTKVQRQALPVVAGLAGLGEAEAEATPMPPPEEPHLEALAEAAERALKVKYSKRPSKAKRAAVLKVCAVQRVHLSGSHDQVA